MAFVSKAFETVDFTILKGLKARHKRSFRAQNSAFFTGFGRFKKLGLKKISTSAQHGKVQMKVLIADDHDLVRDTIAAYIQTDEGTTVSPAANLQDAIALISQDGPFDLVLLDFDMPGMNGLAGLAKALEANDNKPVGIISGTASVSVAEAALEAGAAGFLPKTMSAKSLLNAVRFMAAGETFAPVSFMAQRNEAEHEFDTLLSSREKEVLVGLSKGQANKEIARDLDLREVTVKLHVKTLSKKLNARNRTHAAMIAKESGFI